MLQELSPASPALPYDQTWYPQQCVLSEGEGEEVALFIKAICTGGGSGGALSERKIQLHLLFQMPGIMLGLVGFGVGSDP